MDQAISSAGWRDRRFLYALAYMPSCPYTTHDSLKELTATQGPIGSCREGCGRSYFSCPHCAQANRPLSRYCRQCGESVSFEDAQAKLERNPLPNEGRVEKFKLSSYGVADVQALKSYKGFLIVVADRSVLLYDINRIHEPLLQFRPPDGGLIRGVTLVPSPEDEQLLVTSSFGVYGLSLLTLKTDNQPLYELPTGGQRFITHPVIHCAGNYYVLVLDQPAQSSRLIRLPDQEVHKFEGISRAPLRLDDEQFFFFTRDHIFLYDGAANVVRTKHFPEPLAETDVAYSAELQSLYLVGEGGVWTLSLLAEELIPVNLATRLLSASHLAARDDKVFVAHSQGFAILDPFGGVRWDSTQQFIRAGSDGLRPQLAGEYVLFTALGQNGGTDLRIHVLQRPNDFKVFVYDERLLCPPLLTLGRVLTAMGGGATLVLSRST